jgi:putative ABC transport system ATP-binding protein
VKPFSGQRGGRAAETLLSRETAQSGNSTLDFLADWTDRVRIGVETDAAMVEHISASTAIAGVQRDIHDIGLGSHARDAGRIAPAIGEVRTLLRQKLRAAKMDGLVEPFDPSAFNMQATVGENILFGMPLDPEFMPEALGRNPVARAAMQEADLLGPLHALGLGIARNFVEMFADLESTSVLFERTAGITPERVARLAAIVGATGQKGIEGLPAPDREELLALAMGYVEPRSRFGLLDAALVDKVLAARRLLRQGLAELPAARVAFHDLDAYNPSIPIADNVLFGRIGTNLVGARATILAAVGDVLGELGLSDVAFEAGLAFDMGPGGRNLSEAQRQKLRLARALMKKPDVLILNRALAALSGREQKRILEAVLANAQNRAGKPPAILCAPVAPEHALLFERVLVLEHGRIAGDASPKELLKAQPVFARLVQA